MNWRNWIGKEHVTGDDPTCDEGCDCLLMVTRIREALGLKAPSQIDIAVILLFANNRQFEAIEQYIRPHLKEISSISDGSFTVYVTPESVGAAVFIEDGVLTVSHKKGVRWVPSRSVQKLPWYEWQ